MTCPFLNNNTCEIASDLAEKPVSIIPEVCYACENCERPRRVNVFTANLALTANPKIDEERIHAVINGNISGFGTKLHNLFSVFFNDTPDCQCPGHRDILDVWTPDYISKHLDQVVNWLKYAAIQRRLPFSSTLARYLLRRLLKGIADKK